MTKTNIYKHPLFYTLFFHDDKKITVLYNSESTLWFLDFGDHKRRVQVRPKRFLALRTKTVIDFFCPLSGRTLLTLFVQKRNNDFFLFFTIFLINFS